MQGQIQGSKGRRTGGYDSCFCQVQVSRSVSNYLYNTIQHNSIQTKERNGCIHISLINPSLLLHFLLTHSFFFASNYKQNVITNIPVILTKKMKNGAGERTVVTMVAMSSWPYPPETIPVLPVCTSDGTHLSNFLPPRHHLPLLPNRRPIPTKRPIPRWNMLRSCPLDQLHRPPAVEARPLVVGVACR
jgi:hypothetical protein